MIEHDPAFTTCGYCDESYSLGQVLHVCRACRASDSPPPWRECKVGFTYFPSGEAAYWQHVRESQRHQARLSIAAISVQRMLKQLEPDNWNAMKRRNKVRAMPEYDSLLTLLK